MTVSPLARPFLHAVLLVVGAVTMAATAAESAPTDLVVLIGQSNMDGRGQVAQLTAEQARPVPAIRFFYSNPPASSGGWVPLAPGYSVAPGTKSPVTLPGPTFGPEVGFGPALLAAVPALHLAILKTCKGGTSLAKDWKPGEHGVSAGQGPCYRAFLAAVAAARPALGGASRLRALVWHQGESDAALPAGEYHGLLTTFIARVREDLGEAHLPFVVGEVFDNGKRDAVRAAQRAVAGEIPGVVFVPALGTVTSDKGTHFDAASQLEMGKRYAAALAPLLGPSAAGGQAPAAP